MASRCLQVSIVDAVVFEHENIRGSMYATLHLGRHKVETTPLEAGKYLEWQQSFKLPVESEVTNFMVGIQSTDSGLVGETRVELREALGETGGTRVNWHGLAGGKGRVVAKLCLVVRLVRLAPGESLGMDGPLPVSAGPRSPSRSARSSAQSSPGRTSPSRPSSASTGGSSPLRSPEPSGNAAARPSPSPHRPSGPVRPPAPTPHPPLYRACGRSTSSMRSQPSSTGSAASSKGSNNSQGKKGRALGGKGRVASEGSAGQRILALGSTLFAVAVAIMLVTSRRQRPRMYEVKEGDTVSSIAGCYGLSPVVLVDANRALGIDPDSIYPGDRIYIP